MYQAIEIGTWHIRRSRQWRWTTADGCYSFYSVGGLWRVSGFNIEVRSLLQEHGLFDVPVASSLREAVAVISQLSGCSRSLRRQHSEYEVVDTPMKIARHNGRWRMTSQCMPSNLGTPWDSVCQGMIDRRFDTRAQALEVLDEMLAELNVS